MMRLPSFNSQFKSRLAACSLLALQTAILTVSSELIFTVPNQVLTRTAVAQSSQTEAEEAVVFVQTERGRGSGVVIESDGLIITNAHVVEDARRVEVSIRGRMMDAEVVAMGSSRCLDLALLRVEAQNLPTIEFADASSLRKRQAVYAMGYPGGVPNHSASVVQGIISNIHPREGFLQLDAAINPGNSGGAIVDGDMKLLGIATSGLRDREGIKFAVSIDKVRAFVSAYQQGTTFPIGQFVIPGSEDNAALQPISLDSGSVLGKLEANDSHLCGDLSAADLYSFDAEAGQTVRIDLSSQQIETYLMLVDPNGKVIQRRRGGDERGAIILDKLTQSGTYTVIANAMRPDELGDYQLQVTAPMLVESGAIDLSTAPCTSQGNLCRTFSFAGQANQTISVFHRAEFAPYLMLLDPDGEVVASGRTEKRGTSTFELPADGWYRLVIGNVEPSDRGSFFLSVQDTRDLVETDEVSQR